MPAWRDPYEPTAPSRILLAALERSAQPMTHLQLAAQANITVSWAWKCLQRLMDDGYVREAGHREYREDGTTRGRLPKLYAHTGKAFRHAQPDAPTPSELADVMNAIIRRGIASNRK